VSELSVSIVGAAGYTGGELLRLLLGHPSVTIAQVTSESKKGKPVHSAHPNMRKRTTLTFCGRDELQPCDVLFLCLPHGEASLTIDRFLGVAPEIIDLSADFRLRDADLYRRWYGHEHAHPDLLSTFVYGMPELHRTELAHAKRVSGTGCLATAAILALYPLVAAGLVDSQHVVVDAKVGSSAGGVSAGPDSHHPERSGAMRSFSPVGHRHTAELLQELPFPRDSGALSPRISFSATAIEAVRGILVTAQAFLLHECDERQIWKIYRECYGDEPFVRLVKERQGIYRYPEPKILSGTNFCDVGFALDPEGQRVVAISAIDNLVKGAAGNALQSLNIMHGWPETRGLEFMGLHP
jgi:N-acetyl-gamma-glutamyl-phosphate/LysW-gamma-L-alpha-aminoadipyl-6-phosphate reductase